MTRLEGSGRPLQPMTEEVVIPGDFKILKSIALIWREVMTEVKTERFLVALLHDVIR